MAGNRPFRSWPALAAVIAAGAGLVGSLALAGPEAPVPFRLAVTVDYREPSGPRLLRDELERALVTRLLVAECFEHVAAARAAGDPEADLLVELFLDGHSEHQHFETGLAASKSPDPAPGSKPQVVGRVEARVDLQVRTLPERAVVRRKRYRFAVSQRPEQGQDARWVANERFLDEIVREARGYLCGPSEKKWRKLIEKASSE